MKREIEVSIQKIMEAVKKESSDIFPKEGILSFVGLDWGGETLLFEFEQPLCPICKKEKAKDRGVFLEDKRWVCDDCNKMCNCPKCQDDDAVIGVDQEICEQEGEEK